MRIKRSDKKNNSFSIVGQPIFFNILQSLIDERIKARIMIFIKIKYSQNTAILAKTIQLKIINIKVENQAILVDDLKVP